MKTDLKVVAAFFMLLLINPFQSTFSQNTRPSSVEKALKSLSMEEKVALLVGAHDVLIDTAETSQRMRSVPGAWAYTHALSKCKIPSVTFADVNGGLKMDNPSSTAVKTNFPVPYVLAASWNKDLLYEVGAAIGREAVASGVDVVTTPAANVVRNPLSGRNGEYFSEDPVLAAKLASAIVRGLQSQGVKACLKYWYIDNQEANRTNVNVLASQRTIREIYLKPFEKVVREAAPWGIVAAYPQVNGHYQTEDSVMLSGVLRGKWKYEGVVITDRYAGHDPVAQLLAGIDCLMPGSREQYDALCEACRSGKISEERLNEVTGRLLAAIMRTPTYTRYKASRPDMASHAKLAYRAATESIVLLKNVGESLPLDTHMKKVGFYGVGSYHNVSCDLRQQAAGKSSLALEFMKAGFIPDPTVTGSYLTHLKTFIPQEKKEAAPAAPAKTKPGTAPKTAAKGTPVRPKPLTAAQQMEKDLQQVAEAKFTQWPQELLPSKGALQQQVKTAQFAIVTISRLAVEEGRDRSLENGYRLSEMELSLIRDVCAAYHKWGKKVYVILDVEGMVDVSDWQEYPDAILYCGHAGQGAPAALFDIIVGNSNPSGKLAMVWPKQYNNIPSSHNFPEKYTGKPRLPKVGNDNPMTGYMFVDEVAYAENIRIGYRFFDEHQDQVQYPFGHGLCYTSFACDKLKAERRGDSVYVQVRVTNTGTKDGKESVQLYVSQQRKNLSMEKPLKVMVDFAKTRLLKPDESQMLSMSFSVWDIASFDEAHLCWVLEKGNYTLKIGGSSADIRTQWPLQIMETRTLPVE